MSVSLVEYNVCLQAQDIVRVKARKPLQLITALGEQLPILEHIKVLIKLAELELLHKFYGTENFVATITLKVHFLFILRLNFFSACVMFFSS